MSISWLLDIGSTFFRIRFLRRLVPGLRHEGLQPWNEAGHQVSQLIPGLPQVWSLTQSYSVDFSQSRIGVQ